MKHKVVILFCTLFSINLSSCSWQFEQHHSKRAACNLLKSRMVFNGQTASIRQSQIENAEKPLDQHTYDVNCD